MLCSGADLEQGLSQLLWHPHGRSSHHVWHSLICSGSFTLLFLMCWISLFCQPISSRRIQQLEILSLGRNALVRSAVQSAVHCTISVFCSWWTWLSTLYFSRSMGTLAHELWDNFGQCQTTFEISFACRSADIAKYFRGTIDFHFRSLLVMNRNNAPFLLPFVNSTGWKLCPLICRCSSLKHRAVASSGAEQV